MDVHEMNDEDKIKFKQLLKCVCIDILKKRLEAAEFIMTQAQESANNDEKSSAGDKHETGRAMDQNDRDMNARQVMEAKKELLLIESVQADKIYTTFIPGAVAVCDEQMYFMGAGLGTTELNKKKIILLSAKAPLAIAMHNKKSGDTVTYNNKDFVLTEIY